MRPIKVQEIPTRSQLRVYFSRIRYSSSKTARDKSRMLRKPKQNSCYSGWTIRTLSFRCRSVIKMATYVLMSWFPHMRSCKQNLKTQNIPIFKNFDNFIGFSLTFLQYFKFLVIAIYSYHFSA